MAVFRPASTAPLPIVVFYPGGGFIERYPVRHELCRLIASSCECLVVCVDYRLAPQNPFPAAPEDCYDALAWLYTKAADLGGNPHELIVCGESAGATLASVVCLMNKQRHGPSLSAQILAYPFVGGDADTPSRKEFGPMDHLLAAWSSYTPRPGDAAHPYATPLNAEDLTGLPPTLIFTAACDPLRDEGESLAARLQASGNDVTHARIPDAPHGFLTSRKTPHSRAAALAILSQYVQKLFQNQAHSAH